MAYRHHDAASFHKRRAAAAQVDNVSVALPADRPRLDTFDYAALDAETSALLQQSASAIRTRLNRAIDDVIAIGSELAVAQARLASHAGGTFQAWLRLEFDWSRAQAYNFINVFERFGGRPNIGQLNVGLTALYMLAAPGVPEEAREEAMARAEQGERINQAAAGTIIQSFRPVPPAAPPVAPMSDDQWEQLADQGDAGDDYADPDAVPEDAPMPPYRPPQQPPMTTISMPSHGLTLGQWMLSGKGNRFKVVGLTGSRVALQTEAGYATMELAVSEVSAWQKTDAPPMQPPRPFVTSSEPTASVAPVAPPRALTRGMTSSESEEWYTPAWLIEKVRDCLDGNIDLDPASSELANTVVQAARIYTIDQDALTLPWNADTLFLNPPYGDDLLPFMKKLVDEYAAGSFHRALVLVPARTETRWFYLLRKYPRVFFDSRISFMKPVDADTLVERTDTPFPSALIGIGVLPADLHRHFRDVGSVYVHYTPEA